jgi:hypothetical protein
MSIITSQPKLFISFLKKSNKTKLVLFILINIILSLLKESIFLDIKPYPSYFPKLFLSLYLTLTIMLFTKGISYL